MLGPLITRLASLQGWRCGGGRRAKALRAALAAEDVEAGGGAGCVQLAPFVVDGGMGGSA